ncbi:hypothetical protein [Halorubrum ruber]|uniref:hypothetical protein n=1 Tax=Halorubrum ruber TaxID=2982524 RepID=UPI00201145AE|nr:hypothetical protein [Halorubrum ruber]
MTDDKPTGDCTDRREPTRFTDVDGDPVVNETTQNLTDLLAFLRADALNVYDALDADERERIDRWRREYRRDVSPDVSPDINTDRLLKRVAVDQYRVGRATDAIVRRGLFGDGDHADALGDVVREKLRLSSRRRTRLRRLGVYPVDGGGSEKA